MTYVPSRYNVAGEARNGQLLVFNTLTQNLASFGEHEFSELSCGLRQSSDAERLGFFVPIDVDEYEVAARLSRQLRYAPKPKLSVTIVPSLACNFSCGYCYNGVTHHKGDAKLAAANAVAYVEENLRTSEPLHVTWYGGEPTMFLKEIAEFTPIFQSICEQKGGKFSADILSNGSLLTAKASDLFVASQIAHIQISVDWPLATSQRKWGSRSAEEAIDKVLANISFVSPDIQLTVRVNAMPNFLATFDDLLEKLKSVDRPISIYLHRVYESNITSLNVRGSEAYRYKASSHFYADYLSARKMLRQAGFAQEYFPEQFQAPVCIAQTERDLVFTPDGLAKKCIREVSGPAAVVQNGEKSSGTDSQDRLHFYRHSEVTSDSVCASCQFLPICQGGCVKDAYERPEEVDRRCTPWKFILKQELTEMIEVNACKQ